MGLRDGIGQYGRTAELLPRGALNLHDLGELIRRAGWQAGFIVESEWKVPSDSLRRIDWVWLDPEVPNRPVVAFEIEGPAAPADSIMNDEARFSAARAAIDFGWASAAIKAFSATTTARRA